jgi:hypothetical protein
MVTSDFRFATHPLFKVHPVLDAFQKPSTISNESFERGLLLAFI